ncbi:hypothetical protein BH09PAT4_BH09PAT4_01710 [soil metagenome]
MEDGVTIVPFSDAYAPRIERWYSQDATNALLKLPVSVAPNPQAGPDLSWVALAGTEPVGIAAISLDESSHTGYLLSVRVKPSERRKGIGARLVEHAMQQPATKEISHLRAYAELDNTAAQKILTRAGFSRTGYAAEGRLEYEKH